MGKKHGIRFLLVSPACVIFSSVVGLCTVVYVYTRVNANKLIRNYTAQSRNTPVFDAHSPSRTALLGQDSGLEQYPCQSSASPLQVNEKYVNDIDEIHELARTRPSSKPLSTASQPVTYIRLIFNIYRIVTDLPKSYEKYR